MLQQLSGSGGLGSPIALYPFASINSHSIFSCIILANPPAPYSIQKCPEPQICQKSVPTIAFLGSNQGGPKLSKIVENLKICPEIFVFQMFDEFLTNLGPPDWNLEKQSSGQIFDKFGVRGIFECCKGPAGSQCLSANSLPLPSPCGRAKMEPFVLCLFSLLFCHFAQCEATAWCEVNLGLVVFSLVLQEGMPAKRIGETPWKHPEILWQRLKNTPEVTLPRFTFLLGLQWEQGFTPTTFARGLRDQIQKQGAPDAENVLSKGPFLTGRRKNPKQITKNPGMILPGLRCYVFQCVVGCFASQ